MKVEDNVELADVAKVLVEHLDVLVDHLQRPVRREAERLGKQLDRIEFLIRNGGIPPAPPKP